MSYSAIFFDWDGVITDSVDIKTKIFAELYREHGAEVEKKVVDFHLQHGGVSRYVKFKYFHENFLNMKLSEAEVEQMAQQFSSHAFDAVIQSPFVPGVLETISNEFAKNTLLFIVSATPMEEIKRIVEAKNLVHFFKEIHGSPTTKQEIIKNLISRYKLTGSKCLMIGDAIEDYQAAVDNGVKFLGIAKEDGYNVGFPQGTTIRSEVKI